MLLELSKSSSAMSSKSKAISLTPLIDVVFILLLFFMLSSSFSRWFAIDMSMPAKAHAKQSENLRVRILNNQGKLGVNSDVFNSLNDKLIQLLQKQTTDLILIDAENKVSTQNIVNLIDELHKQGFKHVSLGNTFEQQSVN